MDAATASTARRSPPYAWEGAGGGGGATTVAVAVPGEASAVAPPTSNLNYRGGDTELQNESVRADDFLFFACVSFIRSVLKRLFILQLGVFLCCFHFVELAVQEEWREHTRLWSKTSAELEALHSSKANIWASPQASPRHVNRTLGRSSSGDSGSGAPGPEQDILMSPNPPSRGLPQISLDSVVAGDDHTHRGIPMTYQMDSPGAATTTSSYSYVYSSNNSIPGLLPASSGSTQGSSHGGGGGSKAWYPQHHKQSIVLQSAPGRFGGGGGRPALPQETAMSSLARALSSATTTTAPPPGFFGPPLSVDEELTEYDEDTEADLDYSTASLDPAFLREMSSPTLQRQGSRVQQSQHQIPHSASKAIVGSSSASSTISPSPSGRRLRNRRGRSKPKLVPPERGTLAAYMPRTSSNNSNTLKPHNNSVSSSRSSYKNQSSLAATLESSFSSSRPRSNSHSIRLSDSSVGGGSIGGTSTTAVSAAVAAASLEASGTGNVSAAAASSEAIRQLLKPGPPTSLPALPQPQTLAALPGFGALNEPTGSYDSFPILPQNLPDDYSLGLDDPSLEDFLLEDDDESASLGDSTGSSGRGSSSNPYGEGSPLSPKSKKREWLLRMNRKLDSVPVGELDPSWPLTAIMNAWAKTKSAQGASMVEMWLNRVQQEAEAGNTQVGPTTKMYTMAGASRPVPLSSDEFAFGV
jgi:hypothetical protein